MIDVKGLAIGCTVAVLAGFASGWTTNGCRLNAQISKLEAEYLAEQNKKQQVVIEYREVEAKKNGENTAEFNEALNEKDKYIAKLNDDLDNGHIAFRVCQADYLRATVKAGNSRALEEKARADFASYRKDAIRLIEEGKKADAWIESAFEFVNR